MTVTGAVGQEAAAALTSQVADRIAYAEHVRQVHARGAGRVRRDVFLYAGDSLTAAELYRHVPGSWRPRGISLRRERRGKAQGHRPRTDGGSASRRFY